MPFQEQPACPRLAPSMVHVFGGPGRLPFNRINIRHSRPICYQDDPKIAPGVAVARAHEAMSIDGSETSTTERLRLSNNRQCRSWLPSRDGGRVSDHPGGYDNNEMKGPPGCGPSSPPALCCPPHVALPLHRPLLLLVRLLVHLSASAAFLLTVAAAVMFQVRPPRV